MHAGALLRKWRLDVMSVTQANAAKLLDMSQSSLSEYERGVKSPDVVRALDIEKRTKGYVPVRSWGGQGPKRTGTDD